MQSRRGVLRLGAGLTGGGVLTSLAGCTDDLDGSDTESESGTDDRADAIGRGTGDLDYTDWVSDPTLLGNESVSILQTDLRTILEHEYVPSRTKDGIRSEFAFRFDDVIAIEDIVSTVSGESADVFVGSFDPATVADDSDLSTETSYGGFEIYTDDEADDTVSVATDGTYLLVSDTSSVEYDARDEIEHLIDTATGTVDGAVETDDEFGLVVDELGDGVRQTARTTPDSDPERTVFDTVANGTSTTIDGEETRTYSIGVFESEAALDLDEIETETRAGVTTATELVDISQNGRTVTIDLTFPTDEFTRWTGT